MRHTMENAAKVLPYPIHATEHPESTKVERPPWWIRCGQWIGIMTQPNKPQWSLSPAVVTLLLVIAGIIASAAYYVGHQAAVIEGIQRDASDAKKAAQTAQNIVGGSDVPESTPSPKPKK